MVFVIASRKMLWIANRMFCILTLATNFSHKVNQMISQVFRKSVDCVCLLFQVDGLSMCGLSQEEVADYLRQVPHGSFVKLVVSRSQQESVSDKDSARPRMVYR